MSHREDGPFVLRAPGSIAGNESVSDGAGSRGSGTAELSLLQQEAQYVRKSWGRDHDQGRTRAQPANRPRWFLPPTGGADAQETALFEV